MHSGVLFVLTAVMAYSAAQVQVIPAAQVQVIPAGFIPLPPLPVKIVKPKVTPKSTSAPITKKQTTTKAPFKPTLTSLPPSSRLPQSSHLPPSHTAVPTTPNANCGININIPSANCNGGNTVVQQTLNTLKQELDRTRQQHQAQNAAVQTMITKLQTQQSGYITKISDLQNEVHNLVSAFNSLSGSRPISTSASLTTGAPPVTGVPSTFFLQALQNVRSDLNQAVTDFNNKVFNLSSLMQTNQQQEIQVSHYMFNNIVLHFFKFIIFQEFYTFVRDSALFLSES